MQVCGAGKFCRIKPTGWKWFTRQRSSGGFLWRRRQIMPACPATFIASCAARMCPYSHMGTMKCCGIFRGVVTLPVTSVCVLRHLGGACWIFKEIHWPKMSWSGSGRKFRMVLLWYGTASIRLQRTWSVTKLVWSTLSCRSWRRCPA